MKTLKPGTVVACEFVAQGAHGKHTLVNAYSGNILVGSFPAMFPLAFYIEIFCSESGPTPVNITLSKGEETLAEVQGVVDFVTGQPGVLMFPPIPIECTEPTDIRLELAGDDTPRMTILCKTVSIGQVPAQ